MTSTQPFSYLAQFGVTYDTLSTQQQGALNTRGGPGSATIQVTQQVNQPGYQIIDGMEFNIVQPLDFVLEQNGLRGFGVIGNLTILDQSSTGAAPTFATGIPHVSYNSTLYFENAGWMARVSYVWNGRSFISGSNTQGVCLPAVRVPADTCPGGAYLFAAARGQMDFSSSVKISSLFGRLPSDPEITFDIQNVLNTKLRTFDQYSNATHSYYDQGKFFMFGVRGTF